MPFISNRRWQIMCKVGPEGTAEFRGEFRTLLESRIKECLRYPQLKQPSNRVATQAELNRLHKLATDLAAGLQGISVETQMTLIDVGPPTRRRDTRALLHEHQERLSALGRWLQVAAEAAGKKIEGRKRGPEAASQGRRRQGLQDRQGGAVGDGLDWLVKQCDIALKTYCHGRHWRTSKGKEESRAAKWVRLVANAAAKAAGEPLFTRGQIEKAMSRVSKSRPKLKPRTALTSATVTLKDEDGKEKVVPMQDHPLYEMLARQARRKPVD